MNNELVKYLLMTFLREPYVSERAGADSVSSSERAAPGLCFSARDRYDCCFGSDMREPPVAVLAARGIAAAPPLRFLEAFTLLREAGALAGFFRSGRASVFFALCRSSVAGGFFVWFFFRFLLYVSTLLSSLLMTPSEIESLNLIYNRSQNGIPPEQAAFRNVCRYIRVRNCSKTPSL